jgi:hypothetical protein
MMSDHNTGGAAPETPEGQELASEPDDTEQESEDSETTDLRATEEESSNNEWAP